MTLIPVTALGLRFVSIWLLWKALGFSIDTIRAYNFYDSLKPGTAINDQVMIDFMNKHGDISLQLCETLSVYAFLYFVGGAALMFFSLPLARLLNKGLT